jgi:hypothetical protein
MTTLPNTFNPLITRIEEMFLSGSGTSPYTISTVSYSLDNYYEDKTQEGLAQATLYRPEIKVKILSFDNANAWLQPNTKTMYDIDIGIDIAVHLDSRLLKTQRSTIETQVSNEALKIQKALTYPQNLVSTSAGDLTGLSSGRLQFEGFRNPKFDYKNSVATATVLFSGKIALSNSLQ